VQEELEANGSPRATIETDEERTYFLIDIPCHPYFTKKEIEIDTNGVKEDAESGVKGGVKGGVKDGIKELSDIQEVIVKEMLFDPSVTTSEMAQKTGIKFRTLQRHISQLQAMGIVVRKDGRKDGYWEVVKNK
jgi:ATP-dependent DNA helicase RecG